MRILDSVRDRTSFGPSNSLLFPVSVDKPARAIHQSLPPGCLSHSAKCCSSNSSAQYVVLGQTDRRLRPLTRGSKGRGCLHADVQTSINRGMFSESLSTILRPLSKRGVRHVQAVGTPRKIWGMALNDKVYLRSGWRESPRNLIWPPWTQLFLCHVLLVTIDVSVHVMSGLHPRLRRLPRPTIEWLPVFFKLSTVRPITNLPL